MTSPLLKPITATQAECINAAIDARKRERDHADFMLLAHASSCEKCQSLSTEEIIKNGCIDGAGLAVTSLATNRLVKLAPTYYMWLAITRKKQVVRGIEYIDARKRKL